MNDKEFKKMDDLIMKQTESLREQKISEGMLKGFSTSVERRILADTVPERKPVRVLAWAPALAVMVLASVVVLKSPVQDIQLAQVLAPAEEVQEDIAVLAELGVLDEYEDADLLGEEDAILPEDMELTQSGTFFSELA